VHTSAKACLAISVPLSVVGWCVG